MLVSLCVWISGHCCQLIALNIIDSTGNSSCQGSCLNGGRCEVHSLFTLVVERLISTKEPFEESQNLPEKKIHSFWTIISAYNY